MSFDPIAYNEARLAKQAAIFGGMPAFVKIVTATDPFTTPFDAYVDMFLVAGGPSGGITWGNGNVGGGGAPECAVLLNKFVPAGTTFTNLVGVGGSPVSRSAAGQTAGQSGTASRIFQSCMGLDLRVYPGLPGSVAAAAGFANGGAGGTGGGV
ncbi:MAG: hypothetical protein EOO29_16125, partial [Comamonadaceae bacterium]